MKLIFKNLNQAEEFMKKINNGNKYDAYFKAVSGEVHIIVEEREVTFL